MMNKFIFLAFLLLLVEIDHLNASSLLGKRKNYCSKIQVRDVMNLACEDDGSPQKRSGFDSTSHRNKLDRYSLWQKVFNINATSKLTIPEISAQINLLFGECNEYQRQVEIKNLVEINRKKASSFRENDRSDIFSNYDSSNGEASDEMYRPNSMLRYRRNMFIDECCHHACSIGELRTFCPVN